MSSIGNSMSLIKQIFWTSISTNTASYLSRRLGCMVLECLKMAKMPTVWVSLKKSMHCNSVDIEDVHQPRARPNLSSILRGMSRSSPANSHKECSSPCSIASTDTCTHLMLQDANTRLNAKGGEVSGRISIKAKTTHEAIFAVTQQANAKKHHHNNNVHVSSPVTTVYKKLSNPLFQGCQGVNHNNSNSARELSVCIRCKKHFTGPDALEAHMATSHGVSELKAGDPTRNVVEIIFKSSWVHTSVGYSPKIERVFKINNTKLTVTMFEEYRETVKRKSSKKHPRCMADGNEVLRFYGTTILCSLGSESPTLCSLQGCDACNIMRSGMAATTKEGSPICTANNTFSAHNTVISCSVEGGAGVCSALVKKRAMLVCRVIAGRIHKPLSSLKIMMDTFHVPTGFDSVAGDLGVHSKLEKLYVSNPGAVLPCFLVLYS